MAAVTAGPGITNTITALKNAQLAQSPLVLLGGAAPTALQGRGALQDIDQRPLVEPHVKRFFKLRRVRELGPAVAEAFALAQSGVPGPVFVECPVDLLYDEASIRQWYADAGGKGQALADRALRWYLNRHVRRMFEGSAEAQAPVVTARGGAAGEPEPACAPRWPRCTRPSGRWPSSAARRWCRRSRPTRWPRPWRGWASRSTCRAWRAACSGRRTRCSCATSAASALREADCVLLAGVPCDFRLDYGRHVRRSATLIAANRSAQDARLNRRPDIAAIGDAGAFVQALARQAPDPRRRPRRLAGDAARARRGARGRDRRAGRGAG